MIAHHDHGACVGGACAAAAAAAGVLVELLVVVMLTRCVVPASAGWGAIFAAVALGGLLPRPLARGVRALLRAVCDCV